MLSIPQTETKLQPEDLREYIQWGLNSGTAKSAIKSHGKHWFSHVYKQMKSKQPFGHVFIPDKIDLLFKRRGVFANYTKEKVTASKNFYIVKDKTQITNKVLIAWFNSTIFVSMLMLFGRKISKTWTRFLENDYLELPVINVNRVKDEDLLKIIKNLDEILNRTLPPFWSQLNKGYRYNLDLAIVKSVRIREPEKVIDNLYKELDNI